jgi:hypothetical protein
MRFSPPIPRALRGLCLLALLCVGNLVVQAEMPVFRLDAVFPPSGRVGTAGSLSVTIADGLEARQLVFTHPGLNGEWKEKGRFEVKIAPDVPPGRYEVRAAGSLGFSNPRAFLVGMEEQLVPARGGASQADALELKRGTSVLGKITAATSDHFRLRLQEGERALILCEAQTLDSRLLPILELLDGTAQKMAVTPLKTVPGLTFLDFRAPKAGDYILRLHDLTFSGGAEHFYRLTFSQAPLVETVSTSVLEAGGKRRVTFYGRQLPQGRVGNIKSADGVALEELEVEVEVPASASHRADAPTRASGFDIDGFPFRLQSPGGPSNPVFFTLSATSPVVEPLVAGGTALGGEIQFGAPAVLAGHFYPKSDVDVWSFEAKKGDVWRFEVVSHRLGLGTNPFLWIQKKGVDAGEAWGPDVDLGGPFLPLPVNDPTLKFEAKEDGAYEVRVRDLSGVNVSNPAASYVLAVRRETPDFRLLASVLPPPEIAAQVISAPYAAVLRPGGTLAVRVLAARKDGFAGDIELVAAGLPAGVTCVPTRILAGKNEGYLVLSGQEKLEPFQGAIRVEGRAVIGGKEEVRQARCAVTRWASANVNTTPVEDYLVEDVVLGLLHGEPSPLELTPQSETPREVAVGGKLEVSLRVVRRGEFKDVLKLKTGGAQGVDQIKEVEVPAKADVAKVVLDTAAMKLPAGKHTVYFTTLTKGKFRGKDVTTTFFSTPLAFEVK